MREHCEMHINEERERERKKEKRETKKKEQYSTSILTTLPT
jgi:hypothetical protein